MKFTEFVNWIDETDIATIKDELQNKINSLEQDEFLDLYQDLARDDSRINQKLRAERSVIRKFQQYGNTSTWQQLHICVSRYSQWYRLPCTGGVATPDFHITYPILLFWLQRNEPPIIRLKIKSYLQYLDQLGLLLLMADLNNPLHPITVKLSKKINCPIAENTNRFFSALNIKSSMLEYVKLAIEEESQYRSSPNYNPPADLDKHMGSTELDLRRLAYRERNYHFVKQGDLIRVYRIDHLTPDEVTAAGGFKQKSPDAADFQKPTPRLGTTGSIGISTSIDPIKSLQYAVGKPDAREQGVFYLYEIHLKYDAKKMEKPTPKLQSRESHWKEINILDPNGIPIEAIRKIWIYQKKKPSLPVVEYIQPSSTLQPSI